MGEGAAAAPSEQKQQEHTQCSLVLTGVRIRKCISTSEYIQLYQNILSLSVHSTYIECSLMFALAEMRGSTAAQLLKIGKISLLSETCRLHFLVDNHKQIDKAASTRVVY